MFPDRRVPLQLRYAILRELMAVRYTELCFHDMKTKPVYANRGLMQRMPEAPFLFASIIIMMLLELQHKWRSEGLGID